MTAADPVRRPRLPRAGVVLPNTAFLVVSMGIAAAGFWPIHRTEALLIAVAVALVAGVGIAVAGAARRWPGWAVGGATILAYLLLGVPAAVPSLAIAGVGPTVPGLVALVAGAGLSWKELLTVSLPVGGYQTLLVPVFLLVLVLTVTGLSIALRARWGDLAVLAPITLFAAGILFGPTRATSPLPLALGLLVTVLVHLMWRRQSRRAAALDRLRAVPEARDDHRRAALRRWLGAAVILVLAVTGSVAASVALPASAPRQVLRAAVEVPFDPRDYASPLSAFRRYFAEDRSGTTMLTVDGLRAGERVRIATLDTYDGVAFTVGSDRVSSASAAFTRVPSALEPAVQGGRPVRLDVTVGAYRGVWVPDAGALRTIDFAGDRAGRLRDAFYYNAASGTGAVLGGLATGDRYTIDAVEAPMPDAGAIAALQPGTAPVPELGIVPDELDATLETYTAGAASPGARLAAALAGLRQDGYVSHGGADEPFSRSGHSAERITELLTSRPMLGDAEQYAVTAALMARRLGFPSRVVVGFVAGGDDPADLRGENESAWIEVNAAGAGWVPLDPNPEIRDVPEPEPDDATTVSRPQSVVQPPPDDQVDRDELVPPDVSEEDQGAQQPAWLGVLLAVLRVAGTVLLIAAILVSPFAAIIGAKWSRRRRRRQAPEPLDRIVGGWDEFADSALDYGIDAPATATRNELAMAVGGRKPLVLASAVDRAVFAPAVPAEPDVDHVWAAVADLRAELGTGRTRWERLKALVSVRSLQRRANRRRA
jgi:hypothetical protein